MKDNIDPFAVTDAFTDLHRAWQQDREALIQCCRSLNTAMQATHQKVLDHLQTTSKDPPDDGMELLMNWIGNLSWTSRQYYHVLCEWLTYYVDHAPKLPRDTKHKVRFWVHQIQAMLEPDNFFWANPKAVQRFFESGGESLHLGLRQWMNDLESNNGLVSLADQGRFEVGRDLAVTAGQVVFRNGLMELIQYAPQTAKVRKTPIVLVQPWINKYYIFDLSPRNSFVAYLVGQGYSVFITSWKNPGPEMRDTSFADYMLKGALQAVNVACEVCRSPQVHLAGYCIGGTLIASLMGWLAHEPPPSPVADVTLFSTLLDFSNPGDLAALIHPKAMAAIEKSMSDNGILDEHQIAAAFRLLNPGDLIWRYVVNNYFCGEAPPKSDMLYWNSDSTSLPESMCLFYLKSFYLENRIIRPNALQIGGRAIDLKKVRTPFYIVGAAKDHICPWPSTFQTCRLVGGKARYVLADEGHITGIVNPPSRWSKKRYWAGAATRLRDAQKWLDKKAPLKGSWWPDWIQWLGPRSGDSVPPPPMGSETYPPLGPAPGTYVHE